MWIKSLQDTFYLAAHRDNFKNGGFKEQISATTSPLDAINTFIASPLLEQAEKAMFCEFRKQFIRLQNDNPEKMSPMELTMRMFSTLSLEICDMFEVDMRKRGQYVPPTMIQTVGENGAITSTYTLDSSGKSTHHRGGTLGVVPGAPPEFNAANEQYGGRYIVGVGPLMTKAEDPENKAETGKPKGKGDRKRRAKKPKKMPKNAQGTFDGETSINSTLRIVKLTAN